MSQVVIRNSIIADRPTVNGRIYPREVLERAFKKIEEQTTPIPVTYGDTNLSMLVDPKYIVGNAIDVKVEASIVSLSGEMLKRFNIDGEMNPDDWTLVMKSFGKVENNTVVKIDNVISFNLVKKGDESLGGE